MDARGFPTSLPEFQRALPDDAACARYLEHLRWPHGFVCAKCGNIGEPYRFPKRKSVVLRCRACKFNASLMAGTVMQDSHMPLSIWFWGAYLVTTQTPGQSALQFQRQLRLLRYETAFQILHKLRAGLVRPDRDLIGTDWPVEVDETLVGVRTKGEGRVSTIKSRLSPPSKYGRGRWAPMERSGRNPCTLGDCACVSCRIVAARRSRSLCRKAWSQALWCAPTERRVTTD